MLGKLRAMHLYAGRALLGQGSALSSARCCCYPPPLAAKASAPAALASRGKHCIALTCCSGKVLSGKIRCTIFINFLSAVFSRKLLHNWYKSLGGRQSGNINGQKKWSSNLTCLMVTKHYNLAPQCLIRAPMEVWYVYWWHRTRCLQRV